MATKEYNVIISDRAASELKNHIAFLARVAPDAAKRLHKELISEIESLAFMPKSFPWLYHELLPKNKYRKKIFVDISNQRQYGLFGLYFGLQTRLRQFTLIIKI